MSANPPVRIPLVDDISTRNFTTLQDAKMVNGFVEVKGDRAAGVKRAGMLQAYQGQAGCGQGLVNFINNLCSVSGDYLSTFATVSTVFTQTTANAGWSARAGMMGIGFNGKLWAMGGTNGSTFNNDVYSSSDGIAWGLVTASAPWSGRGYAGVIVLGTKMYVMGGVTATGEAGDVWSTSDGLTWVQTAASAWPGRDSFGVTTFAGKMWVAGGNAGSGGHYSDVWSSLDGVSWVQLAANAPWTGRSHFGFFGFNGKLRVLGGEYSAQLQGAASDLWSSADGITWTRDSSNPFSQAATTVFPAPAITTLGFGFNISPLATITGGGGTGSTAYVFTGGGEEEDGADDFDSITNVTISPGSGYTSAPTLSFTLGGGVPTTGYTFLAANGATGDKRGTMVLAGTTLYYFTDLNAGSPSDEIWQSSDGVVWTTYQANPAFGVRDTTPFYYGAFWILSGNNAGYKTDVWKGSLGGGSAIALSPTVGCLPFSFSQTSSTLTHPLLFFKSNTDAYTYNADLAILSKVTNINYPTLTVPGIVYLDTYFFVMDPQGRIWNSSINDPATWTALGMIPLQGEPNGGVALGKVGNYLVAFGQWSTQFFYDNAVAAPASPLSVNSTLDSLTGCASGDSVVQMQSTLVWMGQTKAEGRGIFTINNLAPTRISTPFIDRLLENDSLASVRAQVTGAVGHFFYVLTLTQSNLTLVYDFKTGVWSVWTSRTPKSSVAVTSLVSNAYGLVTASATNHGLADGDPAIIAGASTIAYNGTYNISFIDPNTFSYAISTTPSPNAGVATAQGWGEGYFIARGAALLNGFFYLQHETSGQIFQFDLAFFDDAGNPIDVRFRTSSWDGGSYHNKTIPNISLIADINTGSAMIRYTNDDYNTYSSYRLVNLTLTRKHITRCGRARSRAFEVRYTGLSPFRAMAIEFTPELSES